MPMRRALGVAGCVLGGALACACGGGTDGAEASSGGGGSGSGGDSACPVGQIAGFGPTGGGGCMPVGIQGCAAMFVAADGLCHPSLDKCPLGTIPDFATGCVPVGIPSCAPMFVKDGLCQPSAGACPAGSFALPQEGCVPIDGKEGCGSGTWGGIADGPNTVWVDPAFAGASDGTKLAPVTTIAAALALVPSGGRVALAAGDYDEPAYLKKPLELVGRCPSLVTVRGVAVVNGAPAIVTVETPGAVTVRGVRVTGAGVGLYLRAASDTVVVDRVHVDHAAIVGVVAAAKNVTITRALIDGTEPDAKGDVGQGLTAIAGCHLTIASSALIRNHVLGLVASTPGTVLAASDVLLAETTSRTTDLLAGVGAQADNGATMTLTATAVVANRCTGLVSFTAGTHLAVKSSAILATLPLEANGELGNGAAALQGASLEIDASAVLANRQQGVLAMNPASTVTITRSLIADTVPQASDGTLGAGATASSSGKLEIVGSTVVKNQVAGVMVASQGTATVTASLLADTLPSASDDHGSGAVLFATGKLSVSGSALAHNRRVALLTVADPQLTSALTVKDSLIADTLAGADDQFGVGIELQAGGSLVLSKSALVGNRHVAISGHDLAIDHSYIADTRADADGSYGVGVACTNGQDGAGKLTLADSVLTGSRTAAVLIGPSTTAEVSRLVVRGVAAGKFHSYDANGNVLATYDGIADGLTVAGASTAHVDGARIEAADRAGLVFDKSGGWLRGVHAAGGQYGLVAQGAPKPDWSDAGNAFTGGMQAILTDGALPVPNAPPAPK